MLARRAELGTTPIVVVDVETTGISPSHHDRIIEIAIIRWKPDTGEIEDEYETLVNPKRDIGRADIHGIAAGELLHAPEFAEIAGDIGRRLGGAILAGHNIRFDVGFLKSEYARVGLALPDHPTVCTLHLAYQLDKLPSRSLSACCTAAGIAHRDAHTAMGDARACRALLTAYLLRARASCLSDVGCDRDTLPDPDWLPLAPSGRSVCRDHAVRLHASDRAYLSRLVERLPATEASSVREAEYLCLLDRVLEDRALTREESEALYGAADLWGMTSNDVAGAHRAYVWALARQAKSDGVVTEMERRDLRLVSELLGVDTATIEHVLSSQPIPATPQPASAAPHPAGAFVGKTVCFTGELLGRIDGQRVTRDVAEARARQNGMLVQQGVTKGLDILVVADPDTQSGKAKKARQYGTRIMAEATFWQALGANVE
jgi:DNA polymerase III subunit epsilon